MTICLSQNLVVFSLILGCAKRYKGVQKKKLSSSTTTLLHREYKNRYGIRRTAWRVFTRQKVVTCSFNYLFSLRHFKINTRIQGVRRVCARLKYFFPSQCLRMTFTEPHSIIGGQTVNGWGRCYIPTIRFKTYFFLIFKNKSYLKFFFL